MEISTVIAIASFLTSIIAVFLSGFLAPRFNAWFEKRYQDRKILKKTLRTLLEIETYVHRKLRHPSISIASDILMEKIKKKDLVDKEQQILIESSLPQLFQSLQPFVVETLPDKFEELDKEYKLVLDELATVDPILAFEISERHLVGPIQQLNNLVINLLNKSGIKEVNYELLNQLADPLITKMINELQDDLRKDILNIAEKIGKKTLKDIKAYFLKRELAKEKSMREMVEEMTKSIPKKTKPEENQKED